ncbi:hypothetical protein [Methylobacterium sp. SD21]|uniref:hypothetical protein n=1 Tax=Methylobacterium litchii TaxID=3138810 RepID=UPI00313AE73D
MHARMFAALALACVCSPALAAAGTEWPTLGYQMVTVVFMGLGLIGAVLLVAKIFARRDISMLVTLAVVGLGVHPALAQDAAAASPGVTIPYGQWIVDFGPQLAGWAATALAGVASWAIAKWAPWASSIATQQRIQIAAEALAQYAIKAVPNSLKDGKVTVEAGPAVIAAAVQRGVNVLPGRVVDAMIKGGGISSIVFRVLDLEEHADESTVLQPAIKALQADPKLAKAA